MPLVEIKHFNPLFKPASKKQTRGVKKLVEISRNNDYTTGNVSRLFVSS